MLELWRTAVGTFRTLPSKGLLQRIPRTSDLRHSSDASAATEGDINDKWSASTIRSMKAFTDYVNAVLPVGHPDIALLALLENHRGGACIMHRSAGQAIARDGRRPPSVSNGTSLVGRTSNTAKAFKASRRGPDKIGVTRVRETKPLSGGDRSDRALQARQGACATQWRSDRTCRASETSWQ